MMNCKSKVIVLLVASLLSLSLDAQETTKPQLKSIVTKPDICYNAEILLDPEIPLADKQIELAHLEASAESGSRMARYLLGSFYRLGENHPAKIFPQDAGKAKIYLSNAAIDGHYAAMAAMAELELKNGNYRDAMLWAQVFAYYSELESKKYSKDSNQAYQAYLLQRIMQFTNKDKKLYSDQQFLDDLHGFHASYNQRIIGSESEVLRTADDLKYEACRNKSESSKRDPITRLSGQSINAGKMTTRKIHSPGYAYFLLTVDSKGKVIKVLTADSMPDANYAKALAYVAKKLLYNESEGTGDRSVWQPMSFDDSSVAIKKTPEKK